MSNSENFLLEFKKLITSEPKRKGKPKLASPERNEVCVENS